MKIFKYMLGISLGAALATQAATITWNTAQTISGYTDVSTQGD